MSASTRMTERSWRARLMARLSEIVVLPEPPLGLAMASTMGELPPLRPLFLGRRFSRSADDAPPRAARWAGAAPSFLACISSGFFLAGARLGKGMRRARRLRGRRGLAGPRPWSSMERAAERRSVAAEKTAELGGRRRSAAESAQARPRPRQASSVRSHSERPRGATPRTSSSAGR